eukprot:TRINITY_DN11246_c0_g1_i1.p1 TRINITY_DN11246_c0_g1~~TRINITY_DN11246_c0_g1_i1.p1  ORF type:complete len:1028 (-),score=248.67 TRINITY_DN11246_c0_g1_i1:20-3103(-)
MSGPQRTFLITHADPTSATEHGKQGSEERVDEYGVQKTSAVPSSTTEIMNNVIRDIQIGDDAILIFREMTITIECFQLLEILFPSANMSVDELRFQKCKFEGSFLESEEGSREGHDYSAQNDTWKSLDYLSALSFVECTIDVQTMVEILCGCGRNGPPRLTIEDIALMDVGLESLSGYFPKGVKELVLSNVGLHASVVNVLLNVSSTRLRYLDLSRNYLQPGQFVSLKKKKSTSFFYRAFFLDLKIMDVSNTFLSDEDIEAINSMFFLDEIMIGFMPVSPQLVDKLSYIYNMSFAGCNLRWNSLLSLMSCAVSSYRANYDFSHNPLTVEDVFNIVSTFTAITDSTTSKNSLDPQKTFNFSHCGIPEYLVEEMRTLFSPHNIQIVVDSAPHRFIQQEKHLMQNWKIEEGDDVGNVNGQVGATVGIEDGSADLPDNATASMLVSIGEVPRSRQYGLFGTTRSSHIDTMIIALFAPTKSFDILLADRVDSLAVHACRHTLRKIVKSIRSGRNATYFRDVFRAFIAHKLAQPEEHPKEDENVDKEDGNETQQRHSDREGEIMQWDLKQKNTHMLPGSFANWLMSLLGYPSWCFESYGRFVNHVNVVSVRFSDDGKLDEPVSLSSRVPEIISKWVDVIPRTLTIAIDRNDHASLSLYHRRVIIDPEITVLGETYQLCSLVLADDTGYSTAFKSADRWFLFDSRISNDQVRSISFKQLSTVSQRHCCFCVYDHLASSSSLPAGGGVGCASVNQSSGGGGEGSEESQMRDEVKRLTDLVSRPCVIIPCELENGSLHRYVCSLPMYRAVEEVPLGVTERIQMLNPDIKTVKLDEMMGFSWRDYVDREFDPLNDLDPEESKDRKDDTDPDDSSMRIEMSITDSDPSIVVSGLDDTTGGVDTFSSHSDHISDRGDVVNVVNVENVESSEELIDLSCEVAILPKRTMRSSWGDTASGHEYFEEDGVDFDQDVLNRTPDISDDPFDAMIEHSSHVSHHRDGDVGSWSDDNVADDADDGSIHDRDYDRYDDGDDDCPMNA